MNKTQPHAGAVQSLNTGAAVAIAVAMTALVIFIAGVLTEVLSHVPLHQQPPIPVLQACLSFQSTSANRSII